MSVVVTPPQNSPSGSSVLFVPSGHSLLPLPAPSHLLPSPLPPVQLPRYLRPISGKPRRLKSRRSKSHKLKTFQTLFETSSKCPDGGRPRHTESLPALRTSKVVGSFLPNSVPENNQATSLFHHSKVSTETPLTCPRKGPPQSSESLPPLVFSKAVGHSLPSSVAENNHRTSLLIL